MNGRANTPTAPVKLGVCLITFLSERFLKLKAALGMARFATVA